MKNVKMIASFVLLLCFTKKALSYPGGAPESQCTDMTPQGSHGSGRPHNNSPFEITSSAIPGGYIPGEMYTVTISKKQTSDPDFKGYLCQVRQVGQTAAFGTFTPRDTTKSKLLDCTRANDAVTHTNRDTVSEQVFEWTPGRLGVGTDVQVVCTVVQQTSTLWVKLLSATFQELELNGTLPPEPITPTIEIVPVPIDFTGCGETKTCYRTPSDCNSASACNFGVAITYEANADTVTILLVSNSGGYAAVGFSLDDLMGHDDVIACQRNTRNQVFAKDTWNPNGHSPNKLDTDDSSIVSFNGSYTDGGIACIIVRKVTPADTNEDYDLTKSYRLLFATSPALGGQSESLSQHKIVPAVSSELVDLGIPQVISVEGKPLLKAHGILMVLAWITLASTGILLARYYKVVWPTGKWFEGHRFHMIVAVLITIIAFIIIFVDVKDFVYDSNNESQHNAHPVLGVIVVFLALANPIMAVFRCHPGTPDRFIFDWAHFLVGISALILGIVTVFLGIDFAREVHFSDLSNNASIILGVWLGIQIVLWVVLEIISHQHKSKKVSSSDTEMKAKGTDAANGDKEPPKEPSEDATIRQGLLILYVVVSVVLSLVVMIYIGIAEV